MKYLIILLPLLFVLSACSSQNSYTKNGITYPVDGKYSEEYIDNRFEKKRKQKGIKLENKFYSF